LLFLVCSPIASGFHDECYLKYQIECYQTFQPEEKHRTNSPKVECIIRSTWRHNSGQRQYLYRSENLRSRLTLTVDKSSIIFLQYSTVQYSTVQYSTVQYSTVRLYTLVFITRCLGESGLGNCPDDLRILSRHQIERASCKGSTHRPGFAVDEVCCLAVNSVQLPDPGNEQWVCNRLCEVREVACAR
jgi:hypothetical protein